MKHKKEIPQELQIALNAFCKLTGKTQEQLSEETRDMNIVYERYLFFRIIKELYGRKYSLATIGSPFGKDHATVLHGIQETHDDIRYHKDVIIYLEKFPEYYRMARKNYKTPDKLKTNQEIVKYVQESITELINNTDGETRSKLKSMLIAINTRKETLTNVYSEGDIQTILQVGYTTENLPDEYIELCNRLIN